MSEFISGVIGALIGFLGSFLALRLEYKKLFAETVSKSRMKWIDNFRKEFSVFFGTCSYLMNQHFSENEGPKKNSLNTGEKNDDETESQKEEALLEAERARVKLLTRLNQDITKQGNEYNKNFSNLLMNIDLRKLTNDGKNNGNSNDFGDIMNQAVKYARKILEPEWARVKKEAKGEEQNV